MTELSRRTVLATAAAAAASPAFAAGMDTARLNAAVDAALAKNSVSVLVLQGGKTVVERYAPAWGPEKSLEVASVGKSFVAVLVGMAIDDGHIKGLDQPAADFVPQWRGTDKAAITLRHLLSMTSGLDDRGLALRNVAGDQFALNAAAPVRDPPGARWAYNTAVYHLLFHVVARAVGERFETYAQKKLLGPLGMTGTTWLTSPGQGAQGPVTNYYTAICTARDLARFGEFARAGGKANGKQLVSAAYVRAMTQPSQALNPAYGLLWWLNSKPGTSAAGGATGLRFPGSPPDTFAALGAGGQAVMVVPSKDLVVIRQGSNPGSETMLPELLAGVVAAAR